MSVWGGIGEGLTAGMNARIALEEQRRREAQAQANADRQFAFQKEQAERAQANADRAYEAGREDALRAQGNSDRDFGLRSRTADLDASLKQQDMELRGALGELDAQMKGEELQGRREDRQFNREKMANDLQMQRERLAGEKEDRALRGELGRAELEGKKEDRKLRREESEERRKGNAEDRAFRKEEAKRNQGNIEADRKFKREDAAADRAFRKGEGEADRAFRKEEGAADRALRTDALNRSDTNAAADREIRSRALDIQENSEYNNELYRNRQIANQEIQNDREYKLKKEAQDWSNKQSEEKIRAFRLANDKLDREERQAKMIDDAKRESGRQQLAAAIYRVTGSGGQEETIVVNENGKDVLKKVRVLPHSTMFQIFGTDGYFKDVQDVVSFEDENGNTVAALVKPDGTMQMFSPEQQYDIYNGAFGKGFADEQMRAVGEKKDLGMFAAKEQAKADAQVKAREASDPYGRKRQIDAAVAVLKADDASDSDREAALQYLGSVFANGNGSAAHGANKEWVGANGKPMSAADVAKLKAEGYEWDSAKGRPVKKQRPTVPGMGRYNTSAK